MNPRKILIMRHAEKPEAHRDPHLSPEGEERAARLVTYIPETFGIPDFLFATQESPDSNRPFETLKPLSDQVGIPIDQTFSDGQHKALAEELLSDPRYNGALALVCWHHEKIPKLAAELGAIPSEVPDPWDDAVYDLVLALEYAGGPPPSLTKVVEPF
ncbi:MAG: histidine phosphatase family protein [Verrucomicrobia bacterium]|nr:histidine phosphatase family protein [Verrucomicrobiota bacterium]